jgi:hypothetical protein
MTTENLFINDGCYRQAVEAICEGLPELNIIPPFTFIIETIDSVNAGTLVIAAQQEEVLWILNFVRKQQTDGLQGLLATVHIIPQKEVVGFWWKPTILKQSKEVIVLAMYVT